MTPWRLLFLSRLFTFSIVVIEDCSDRSAAAALLCSLLIALELYCDIDYDLAHSCVGIKCGIQRATARGNDWRQLASFCQLRRITENAGRA